MLSLFQAMADYNAWMNANLYAACATLSDDERKRDVNAPFKSIHGTLNHLLLADRVWLGRFSGVPFAFATLRDELFADFDELWRERIRADDEIRAFVQTLTERALGEEFRWTPMSSSLPRVAPLWFAMSHLFNHQTHHRGQLTTLLEQAGVDFGVTDLHRMPTSPMRVLDE